MMKEPCWPESNCGASVNIQILFDVHTQYHRARENQLGFLLILFQGSSRGHWDPSSPFPGVCQLRFFFFPLFSKIYNVIIALENVAQSLSLA